jgi:predicted aspartyl protease
VNPYIVAIALAAAPPVLPGAPTPDVHAPNIPPASLDDTLEVTGESVAAKVIETRMAVDVMLEGRGPYRFIVDSGADRSVIGATLAARLGLEPAGTVTLNGMAGTSRVETVRLNQLTIGESDVFDIVAPALPERDLGAQGLLGIDALAEQRLMLDFEKKAVTVQGGRRPAAAPSGSDEIVVTARRRNGQLILTEVMAANRTIYAVIDTGSQATIGNSALLERISRLRRPPPGRPVSLVSVTGEIIVANEVLLPELRIGGALLKDVRVAFVDAPPFALFGLTKQPALLLGTDVLGAFRRVSLDFHNRKVRFTLRR